MRAITAGSSACRSRGRTWRAGCASSRPTWGPSAPRRGWRPCGSSPRPRARRRSRMGCSTRACGTRPRSGKTWRGSGAIVGDDRVGTPVPADTHRPDAFVLERPAEAVPPAWAGAGAPSVRADPAALPPALAGARPLRGGPAGPARERAAGGRGARRARARGAAPATGGNRRRLGRRDLAGGAGRGRRSTSSPARTPAGASRGSWTRGRSPGIRAMPYVELHARSAFSFLRGGSLPESLVAEAARLEMPALALCDRDGVYGAVRLHMSGQEAGVRALVGCELTMEDGGIVPVLVATRAGYQGLCRLLTTAHLRRREGGGARRLARAGGGERGAGRAHRRRGGPGAARVARARAGGGGRRRGRGWRRIFTGDRLHVEIQRHRIAGEERWNRFLVDWAGAAPAAASRHQRRAPRRPRRPPAWSMSSPAFATTRRSTRRAALLAPQPRAPPEGAAARWRRCSRDLPEAVANTERLAERLEFTLANLGYRFPDYPVPAGESQDSFLRKMTYFGAQQRYGSVGRARCAASWSASWRSSPSSGSAAIS